MHRARLLAVAIVVVVALAGCDWAQFGFGPDQTSYNPSEPALTPSSVAHLNVAWSTPCFCLWPALVADGLVYIAEPTPDNAPRDVTIDVRDVATGAPRWSTTFRQVTDARVIGVANGLAYVRVGSLPLDGAFDTSDLILAFDATTGKLRWFLVPPAAAEGVVMISSWLVDGPRLFLTTRVPGGGYVVSAIDTSGRAIWSRNAPGTVEGIVADPGRTLHAVSFVKLHPDGSGTGVLTSFAESTGAVTAARFADLGPFGLALPSPVSFANGLVYAVSVANTIQANHTRAVAVRVATGVQAWSQLDETVAVVAPNAVITSGNGVFARNPTTGALLWSKPSGVLVGDGQYAAATGGVVFANQSGLRAFRLSDGAVLSTTAAGGQISIAEGRVVVAGSSVLQILTPTG